MDLQHLAIERSLAFHRAIAERLLRDPSILEAVRQRVKAWMAENPQRPFIKEWMKILVLDPKAVADFLVDKSERATELRQSSPFTGILSPRERWQIWSDTRQAIEGKG